MKWLLFIAWLVAFLLAWNGLAQDEDETPWFYEKYIYSDYYWEVEYDIHDRRPYGGFMLQEMLAKRFAFEYVSQPVAETMDVTYYEDGGFAYVVYAFDLHWRVRDYNAMLDFVRYGNDAIFICEYIPATFQELIYDTRWGQVIDTAVQVYYYPDDESLQYYNLTFLSNFESQAYPWRYIPSGSVNDRFRDSTEQLVRLTDNNVVCQKVSYGEGNIYFYTVPVAFSNLYLKTDPGRAHFDWFFSRFEDKRIFLDSESPYKPVIYTSVGFRGSGGSGSGGSSEFSDYDTAEPKVPPLQSPLEFVFANWSLTWAYILLLVLGILYVIYKGKRRQKVVPLLETDSNSSVEFVGTVSQLYLSKRQHRNLVIQKKRTFKHFIRTRYFITGSEEDSKYLEQLETRSGVERSLIDRIFNGFSRANNKSVSTQELIDLHKDIELFYKNCI